MPQHRSPLPAAALLAASLTLLTACGGSAPSASDPTNLDASAANDRTLDVIGPYEVHSIDPATAEGIFTRLQVAETLVEAAPDGELLPGLATSWSASGNGLSWKFTLREGATFHDGTAVDADAVAAALEAARGTEANTISSAPVEEVRAEGGTVVVELSKPFAPLPAVLAATSTQILAPSAYAADGSVTEVVGSGPYKVVEVAPPARIELEAFKEYDGTAAQVERVAYQSVGRAENRALMAESGQADIAFGMDPTSLQRLKGGDGFSVESVLLPRSIMLKLNAGHPALADRRVRQALSMALDREAMATAVLRDPEVAATQMFPPALPAWHDAALAPLAHDTQAAADLLDDAGWLRGADGTRQKDGEALNLTLLTFPDRPELPTLATAIQAALKEVGVAVDIRVDNSSEIPAGHHDGSLDMALFARNFALVPDPAVTLLKDYPKAGGDWGSMGWNDPGLDAALQRLATDTDRDGAGANAARHEVAGILQEQQPVLPVAWYRQSAVVSESVRGFELDPLERGWGLAGVSLQE